MDSESRISEDIYIYKIISYIGGLPEDFHTREEREEGKGCPICGKKEELWKEKELFISVEEIKNNKESKYYIWNYFLDDTIYCYRTTSTFIPLSRISKRNSEAIEDNISEEKRISWLKIQKTHIPEFYQSMSEHHKTKWSKSINRALTSRSVSADDKYLWKENLKVRCCEKVCSYRCQNVYLDKNDNRRKYSYLYNPFTTILYSKSSGKSFSFSQIRGSLGVSSN